MPTRRSTRTSKRGGGTSTTPPQRGRGRARKSARINVTLTPRVEETKVEIIPKQETPSPVKTLTKPKGSADDFEDITSGNEFEAIDSDPEEINTTETKLTSKETTGSKNKSDNGTSILEDISDCSINDNEPELEDISSEGSDDEVLAIISKNKVKKTGDKKDVKAKLDAKDDAMELQDISDESDKDLEKHMMTDDEKLALGQLKGDEVPPIDDQDDAQKVGAIDDEEKAAIHEGDDEKAEDAVHEGDDEKAEEAIHEGDDEKAEEAIHEDDDEKAEEAIHEGDDEKAEEAIREGDDEKAEEAIREGDDEKAEEAIHEGDDEKAEEAIHEGDDEKAEEAIHEADDEKAEEAIHEADDEKAEEAIHEGDDEKAEEAIHEGDDEKVELADDKKKEPVDDEKIESSQENNNKLSENDHHEDISDDEEIYDEMIDGDENDEGQEDAENPELEEADEQCEGSDNEVEGDENLEGDGDELNEGEVDEQLEVGADEEGEGDEDEYAEGDEVDDQIEATEDQELSKEDDDIKLEMESESDIVPIAEAEPKTDADKSDEVGDEKMELENEVQEDDEDEILEGDEDDEEFVEMEGDERVDEDELLNDGDKTNDDELKTECKTESDNTTVDEKEQAKVESANDEAGDKELLEDDDQYDDEEYDEDYDEEEYGDEIEEGEKDGEKTSDKDTCNKEDKTNEDKLLKSEEKVLSPVVEKLDSNQENDDKLNTEEKPNATNLDDKSTPIAVSEKGAPVSSESVKSENDDKIVTNDEKSETKQITESKLKIKPKLPAKKWQVKASLAAKDNNSPGISTKNEVTLVTSSSTPVDATAINKLKAYTIPKRSTKNDDAKKDVLVKKMPISPIVKIKKEDLELAAKNNVVLKNLTIKVKRLPPVEKNGVLLEKIEGGSSALKNTKELDLTDGWKIMDEAVGDSSTGKSGKAVAKKPLVFKKPYIRGIQKFKPAVYDMLKAMKITLVGMDYLVEVWKEDGKSPPRYYCAACKTLKVIENLEEHIASLSHKLQIMRVTSLDCWQRFPATASNWPEGYINVLDDISKHLAQQRPDDIQSMLCTSLHWYNLRRRDIDERVRRSSHPTLCSKTFAYVPMFEKLPQVETLLDVRKKRTASSSLSKDSKDKVAPKKSDSAPKTTGASKTSTASRSKRDDSKSATSKASPDVKSVKTSATARRDAKTTETKKPLSETGSSSKDKKSASGTSGQTKIASRSSSQVKTTSESGGQTKPTSVTSGQPRNTSATGGQPKTTSGASGQSKTTSGSSGQSKTGVGEKLKASNGAQSKLTAAESHRKTDNASKVTKRRHSPQSKTTSVRKRSISPRRRSPIRVRDHSPARRRSPLRRSPARRSSPFRRSSPARRISPFRRTSPARRISPFRKTSPARRISPFRKTSPARRVSPFRRTSPARRTSPFRRTSPARRVSPFRRTSPARRISPFKKVSPRRSPARRTSPRRSPLRRLSPRRSPLRRLSSRRSRSRSRSPLTRFSPRRSPARRSPLRRVSPRRSPLRRLSPRRSPLRRLSPSRRSPVRISPPRKSIYGERSSLRRRSSSPRYRSQSPRRRSRSPDLFKQRSPLPYKREGGVVVVDEDLMNKANPNLLQASSIQTQGYATQHYNMFNPNPIDLQGMNPTLNYPISTAASELFAPRGGIFATSAKRKPIITFDDDIANNIANKRGRLEDFQSDILANSPIEKKKPANFWESWHKNHENQEGEANQALQEEIWTKQQQNWPEVSPDGRGMTYNRQILGRDSISVTVFNKSEKSDSLLSKSDSAYGTNPVKPITDDLWRQQAALPRPSALSDLRRSTASSGLDWMRTKDKPYQPSFGGLLSSNKDAFNSPTSGGGVSASLGGFTRAPSSNSLLDDPDIGWDSPGSKSYERRLGSIQTRQPSDSWQSSGDRASGIVGSLSARDAPNSSNIFMVKTGTSSSVHPLAAVGFSSSGLEITGGASTSVRLDSSVNRQRERNPQYSVAPITNIDADRSASAVPRMSVSNPGGGGVKSMMAESTWRGGNMGVGPSNIMTGQQQQQAWRQAQEPNPMTIVTQPPQEDLNVVAQKLNSTLTRILNNYKPTGGLFSNPNLKISGPQQRQDSGAMFRAGPIGDKLALAQNIASALTSMGMANVPQHELVAILQHLGLLGVGGQGMMPSGNRVMDDLRETVSRFERTFQYHRF